MYSPEIPLIVHPPIVPDVDFNAPADVTLNSALAGVASPVHILYDPLDAIPVAPPSAVKSVLPIVQPPIVPLVAVTDPVIANVVPSQVQPAVCPIFPTLILVTVESIRSHKPALETSL